MISDKLLINLKILSKLQKNGKLARSCDGIIALEHDTFYQPIKRFLSSDSRNQTICEVNSIISDCINTIRNIVNCKFLNPFYSQTDEYSKGCEELSLLLDELANAKNGIECLKFTYQSDANIASKLDVSLLRIDITLRDVTNKYNYLTSFNSEPQQAISNNQPHNYSETMQDSNII